MLSKLTLEEIWQNLNDSDKLLLEKLIKSAEVNISKNQIRMQIARLQEQLERLDSGNEAYIKNAVSLGDKCEDSLTVAENTAKLRIFLESGNISDGDIILLQDSFYCKQTFNLNYPVLSKRRFDARGYARYYKDPVKIGGESFYLCAHWLRKNIPQLQEWIKERS